jgi:CRISPR/Cas system CMR-associated protein Cmr5 small subunit
MARGLFLMKARIKRKKAKKKEAIAVLRSHFREWLLEDIKNHFNGRSHSTSKSRD